MTRLLVLASVDAVVAVWLLLSYPRQRRHREAVLAVAFVLLVAAVLLAVAGTK